MDFPGPSSFLSLSTYPKNTYIRILRILFYLFPCMISHI